MRFGQAQPVCQQCVFKRCEFINWDVLQDNIICSDPECLRFNFSNINHLLYIDKELILRLAKVSNTTQVSELINWVYLDLNQGIKRMLKLWRDRVHAVFDRRVKYYHKAKGNCCVCLKHTTTRFNNNVFICDDERCKRIVALHPDVNDVKDFVLNHMTVFSDLSMLDGCQYSKIDPRTKQQKLCFGMHHMIIRYWAKERKRLVQSWNKHVKRRVLNHTFGLRQINDNTGDDKTTKTSKNSAKTTTKTTSSTNRVQIVRVASD